MIARTGDEWGQVFLGWINQLDQAHQQEEDEQ